MNVPTKSGDGDRGQVLCREVERVRAASGQSPQPVVASLLHHRAEPVVELVGDLHGSIDTVVHGPMALGSWKHEFDDQGDT